MNLFFADGTLNGDGILDADDAHHCFRVMRAKPGERVLVTDGRGKIYEATLTAVDKKNVSFALGSLWKEESGGGLHIAIAPTKNNDRFEYFLEKATELGVERITPLLCRRSERKVYKHERGLKVIKAAIKQSKRAYAPILDPMTDFNTFIEQDHRGYIAHLNPTEQFSMLDAIESQKALTVLIGPEGDFDETEIDKALEKGYKSLNLGNNVLRTETAGVFIAASQYLKSQ